jgi:hypothetical protein
VCYVCVCVCVCACVCVCVCVYLCVCWFPFLLSRCCQVDGPQDDDHCLVYGRQHGRPAPAAQTQRRDCAAVDPRRARHSLLPGSDRTWYCNVYFRGTMYLCQLTLCMCCSEDPRLAEIRSERGYSYSDVCEVSPEKYEYACAIACFMNSGLWCK